MNNENAWLLFSDKQSALDARRTWEEQFPPQESSYRPSGQISKAGRLVLFTAGAGAGVAGSILGGSATALLSGYLTALALHLAVWLRGRVIGNVVDLGSALAPIVMLASLCLLTGVWGALAVRSVSHRVKNRHVKSAAVVGGFSSSIGAFVLCRWILPLLASHLLNTIPAEPDGFHFYSVYSVSSALEAVQDGGVALWIVLCLCVVTSASMGASVAAHNVKTDKFCEDCSEYMAERQLTFVSLESAAKFAKEVRGGALPSSLDGELVESRPTGSTVTVFQCDRCKTGYVDVHFEFLAKWPSPRKKGKFEKSRTRWLIASAPVTAEQITKSYV